MIRTGQTVYEQIISVDPFNNPVTGTTFTSFVFKDGVVFTGITVSLALSIPEYGIFNSSWSADTIGEYQLFHKNDVTNVLYITEIHSVRPDSEFDQTIYIGL